MKTIKEIGEHKILSYDINIHPFIEYFIDLYNTNKLEDLHLNCTEYIDLLNNKINDISDYDTELHKIFYSDIKNNTKFKVLYCNLIKDIYKNIFPEQDYIIYQSFPSIRFQ